MKWGGRQGLGQSTAHARCSVSGGYSGVWVLLQFSSGVTKPKLSGFNENHFIMSLKLSGSQIRAGLGWCFGLCSIIWGRPWSWAGGCSGGTFFHMPGILICEAGRLGSAVLAQSTSTRPLQHGAHRVDGLFTSGLASPWASGSGETCGSCLAFSNLSQKPHSFSFTHSIGWSNNELFLMSGEETQTLLGEGLIIDKHVGCEIFLSSSEMIIGYRTCISLS